MALDDIQKLNDEINKLRAELGKRPLKPFDKDDLERAKSLLSGLRAEVREMGNDLDYVANSFKDSVNELSKQNVYLSDARKALNGIANISQKVIDYRRGESSLSEKQLKDLKNQARIRSEELERIKKIGILGGKNQAKNKKEINESLAAYDLFEKAIDKTITAQKEVNKEIGLVGTGIEGISKGLSKMGFGDFSQPLTEAIQKTKDARLQIKLNGDLAKENSKKLQDSEAEFQNLQSTGYRKLKGADRERFKELNRERKEQQLIVNNMAAQNAELSTQTSKYKNIVKALTDQLTKANLIDFAIQQMVDALIKADTQTGQLAKAFGTSYSEAASMRNELNTVANLSGDINITTGALQESLIAVNKEFGTATMFSGELLTDFTNMTKVMGYTDEAAAKLSKITVATGTDLSDNTAQILGTAAAFNVTNGLALNEKEIVEDVAKASAAVTVSLGMQTKAISGAVLEAKKLGLELSQVEGIAKSLLNFESSISSELEAELITGRALNLEQARYYALTNDVEGVAREIAKQNITAAEYTGMNSIAAEALAESLGLSREELAQSLMNQEALNKAGMVGKTTQEAYAALKKDGLSDDQIAEKLGNDILARQMKSQSIQDRFNASVEKLQEIFVSLAEPILQIVSPFMDLVSTVLPAINLLLLPFTESLKLIGNYSKEILSIFTVYKGVQLGINIAKGAEYALDLRKSAVAKGELGFKQMSKFVENETLAIKITAYTLTLRDMVAEKAKAGWKLLQIGYETTLNGIKRIGALISKGELLQSIGKAAMGAIASLSSIPVIGWALGLAAAGTAVALGYKFMKGDDIMSPGNKTSGYGERTLLGPEGAIQLNNKDTVIAGTNLFDGTAQATSPSVSINMAPLVNEMQAVKAVLVQILNKDSNVYMDGAKVGKGVAMASSKIG